MERGRQRLDAAAGFFSLLRHIAAASRRSISYAARAARTLTIDWLGSSFITHPARISTEYLRVAGRIGPLRLRGESSTNAGAEVDDEAAMMGAASVSPSWSNRAGARFRGPPLRIGSNPRPRPSASGTRGSGPLCGCVGGPLRGRGGWVGGAGVLRLRRGATGHWHRRLLPGQIPPARRFSERAATSYHRGGAAALSSHV